MLRGEVSLSSVFLGTFNLRPQCSQMNLNGIPGNSFSEVEALRLTVSREYREHKITVSKTNILEYYCYLLQTDIYSKRQTI